MWRMMMVSGQQENLLFHSYSPWDWGGGEADPLLQEISISFLQPSRNKSAFKSGRLRATQVPLCASLPSPSLHPQLIELSGPEHKNGSLLRRRDLGGALEGFRILEISCQCPHQMGVIPRTS